MKRRRFLFGSLTPLEYTHNNAKMRRVEHDNSSSSPFQLKCTEICYNPFPNCVPHKTLDPKNKNKKIDFQAENYSKMEK